MALAIDSSTPGPASQAVSQSATTASFNPPASLLVACVAVLDQGSVPTVTISNNGAALTWTRIVVEDRSNGQPNGSNSIWYAVLTAPRTGMTVTVSNSTFTVGFQLYVITGADPTSPIGASSHGSSTSGNFTTTAFTSTANNSLAFCSAGQYVTNGPSPVLADATSSVQVSAPFAAFGYKTLGASGSSATFHITDSASTRAINWVTAEVKAPTSASLSRSVSDTATATDACTVELPRAASDTAAAADTCTRHTSLPRALSDTATAIDVASSGIKKIQARSISETLRASDVAAPHRSFYLTTALVADTARATDETSDVEGSLPAPLLRLSALVGDTDNIIAIALNNLMTFPSTPGGPSGRANTGTNIVRSASLSEMLGAGDRVTAFTDQKLAETAHATDAAAAVHVRGVVDVAAAADAPNTKLYDVADVAAATDEIGSTIAYLASASDVALGRFVCDDVAVAS